ncbi:dephospho-CoA kinase [Aggregicoccus sp. 17bor-14]|uniref:dephospho-CoA kinase n=1 Tax=Myxococcaceae TaxID=31 RepID=UPI0012EF0E57|nr:dephospho-CoA kinase [Simulacricoccus sp. 17bor-14]MRI87006.1 dephospho-CoA kinase [Aggregicoccus sp. 17bor-14]
MHLYGLTGGIASGKSTVSRMLRELGAQVLDADVLAREVVASGTPGLAEVAARFPGVLGPDGGLDRAKLGQRVFADASERAALNALLHPRIAQAFLERTQALAEAGAARVIYDAPLLIENGLHTRMEGVILVAVPREVQLARLMARDGLSREAAEARLASQLPLEDKRRHATWVVDNAGELAATRAQVERIWEALLARG